MDDEKRQGLEIKDKMVIPASSLSSKVCFVGEEYDIPLTQDVFK